MQDRRGPRLPAPRQRRLGAHERCRYASGSRHRPPKWSWTDNPEGVDARMPECGGDRKPDHTRRYADCGERQIINHHIVSTIRMLEALPWPRHLKNVPEYAGGHHERMDGKGYPRGLARDQMSVQARVMGIADIFEALTAKDRPYKRPMRLSEALPSSASSASTATSIPTCSMCSYGSGCTSNTPKPSSTRSRSTTSTSRASPVSVPELTIFVTCCPCASARQHVFRTVSARVNRTSD
jgi:hypothetical protein